MVPTLLLNELFEQKRRYINHFFDQLNDAVVQQVYDAIRACSGELFVTGVGKSGIIAQKIAATLVSTSMKARYLSPVEAVHGDLGSVCPGDILLVLSKSGESDELLELLPFVRNKGAKTIAVVCNIESRLAKSSDLAVELPLERELCPFGLAPTTSATLQLIFGDVLTVALMHDRGFTVEEYASNHPAGAIGRRISMRVKDIMLTGDDLPLAKASQTLGDSLVTLSDKRCGSLLVVDDTCRLLGIFTDGDLRRALQSGQEGLVGFSMQQVMQPKPRSVVPDQLAWDALREMEKNQNNPITVMPVIDHAEQVVGLVRLHDILQAGLG